MRKQKALELAEQKIEDFAALVGMKDAQISAAVHLGRTLVHYLYDDDYVLLDMKKRNEADSRKDNPRQSV